MGSLFGAVATRRDRRLSACGMDACHQRISIVSLVANDRLGAQALDQCAGLRNIGHLASRQSPAHPPWRESWCSARRASARAVGGLLFLGAGSVLVGAHNGAVDEQCF